MLVIRLTRIGKKNQPVYRVVLADKKRAVQGKFIEILGSYNPRLKTKAFKAERINYWISKGAQVSPTVHNLLVTEKIIESAKVKAWRPKVKGKTEAKPEAKAAPTPSEEAKEETSATAPSEDAKTEEKVA